MTKHFKKADFECPCCKVSVTSHHLMAVLELVLLEFDKQKLTVISGYRCPKHNDKVGGREDSKHLSGMAAEISIEGINPEDIFDFLNVTFPRSYGIGLCKDKVHIDVRSNRARWRDE